MKRLFSLILAAVLCLSLAAPAAAAQADVLSDVAAYVQKTTPNPTVGSVGGEWAVLGLARGGYPVPASYYQNVESYVRDCGGILHSRKYTEYSRVVLALTAIGKDPTNVAGYDLVQPLSDFEKTVWQGINGPIWALIALDSGNYVNQIRQSYVEHILANECTGGGWSLAGEEGDADVTAMALQALAKYRDQAAVKAAVERGLSWLSSIQNADGTFSTAGEDTCESTAQVIVALGELGLPLTDSRFVKNGKNPMDGLLRYYQKGKGFVHVLGGSSDAMATEQAFYALVSADRVAKGQSSLYYIGGNSAGGLSDIAGHKNQKAIEVLVEKQIINGMGDGTFEPNKTMTRAQFCTIVVKALGLSAKETNTFSDVKSGAWYAGFVGAASTKGIVNGVGNGRFLPEGTITRQEAATMVARAAKQLGMETAVTDTEELLALFSDGGKVASYAKDAVAYCYESGILTDGGSIQPTKAILRCEIAQMIYNLLKMAGKLS